MPELIALLEFLKALRQGVKLHPPRRLARFFADIRRTDYRDADVETLRQSLRSSIRDEIGELAVEEFDQEVKRLTGQ